MNVYETCPVLTTPRFTLRLVAREDAPALLAVYGTRETQPYLNADNCTNDFFFPTLQDMLRQIDFWLEEYARGYYVRWSILEDSTPIGTVEMFHRESCDAFNHHALVRLDLRPDREQADVIEEITAVLLARCSEMFSSLAMATKARPVAAQRCTALARLGFTRSEAVIVGHDGTEYCDYWVRCLCR